MIESPSGRMPEKAPIWDLTGTEGCGGGISFLAPYLIVWGFWNICEYIGGRSRSGSHQGAHEGGGHAYSPWERPPASWTHHGFSNFNYKSSGFLSVQEKSSRRFYSVWTPFGIPFLQNSKTRKKQELALGSRLIG